MASIRPDAPRRRSRVNPTDARLGLGARELLPLVSENLCHVSPLWRRLEEVLIHTLQALSLRPTTLDHIRGAYEDGAASVARFLEERGLVPRGSAPP